MNCNKIFILSNKIDENIISFFRSIDLSICKINKIEKGYPILFKDYNHDIFFGSKLEYSLEALFYNYPYSKYIVPTDGNSPSNQSLKRILSSFAPQEVSTINSLIAKQTLNKRTYSDFSPLNNSILLTFKDGEENFIKKFLNFINTNPIYNPREISVVDSIN